jgi:hypothetical protein
LLKGLDEVHGFLIHDHARAALKATNPAGALSSAHPSNG